MYIDNDAKYWATNFLELTEIRNDRDNTKVAYTAIHHELKRKVKSILERDYFLLSNSFYQKLRSAQLINYPVMIQDMLNEYQPDNDKLNVEMLKRALLALHETKKFDSQFHSIPDALNKELKFKFIIMNDVELNIKGAIEDVREAIGIIKVIEGQA